jgi:hypothetical protein
LKSSPCHFFTKQMRFFFSTELLKSSHRIFREKRKDFLKTEHGTPRLFLVFRSFKRRPGPEPQPSDLLAVLFLFLD